jgi:AmiR/NasT family two-component response regulator
MDEAFRMLRDHARSHGIPLADVAESIVNRTLIL